jgi:outer membrane biosynthesis protein TonB
VRGLVDSTYAVPLKRELRECCTELFGKGKEAVVVLTIAASGDVLDAQIGRSTPSDERLHGVLLAHAKAWKFPKVKAGGQAVKVECRLAL